MVGVPEVADDVHGTPQNMIPPPPPIDRSAMEEISLFEPPMPPSMPVYNAAYFGVNECNTNTNSSMLEYCNEANTAQFALRRPLDAEGSLCTCHDPFTGSVTLWDQECSQPCPSEDGMTCAERRAADLETLAEAEKYGYQIADFTVTICEDDNEALFSPKTWAWTGHCFCKSPLTGVLMGGPVTCDFECPTIQNGALTFS